LERIFDCGRVLCGSRVAEIRRRVTVHTGHQLKQASKHHKQKRASLVATGAIVVERPRTIVGLVAVRVKLVCVSLVSLLGVPPEVPPPEVPIAFRDPIGAPPQEQALDTAESLPPERGGRVDDDGTMEQERVVFGLGRR